jgi:hypothetical protein
MNAVMKIFKDEQLPQQETLFELKCQIKTSVRLSESQRIRELLEKTEGVTVSHIK